MSGLQKIYELSTKDEKSNRADDSEAFEFIQIPAASKPFEPVDKTSIKKQDNIDDDSCIPNGNEEANTKQEDDNCQLLENNEIEADTSEVADCGMLSHFKLIVTDIPAGIDSPVNSWEGLLASEPAFQGYRDNPEPSDDDDDDDDDDDEESKRRASNKYEVVGTMSFGDNLWFGLVKESDGYHMRLSDEFGGWRFRLLPQSDRFLTEDCSTVLETYHDLKRSRFLGIERVVRSGKTIWCHARWRLDTGEDMRWVSERFMETCLGSRSLLSTLVEQCSGEPLYDRLRATNYTGMFFKPHPLGEESRKLHALYLDEDHKARIPMHGAERWYRRRARLD